MLQFPISLLYTYEYIPKMLQEPIFIVFQPSTFGLKIIKAFYQMMLQSPKIILNCYYFLQHNIEQVGFMIQPYPKIMFPLTSFCPKFIACLLIFFDDFNNSLKELQIILQIIVDHNLQHFNLQEILVSLLLFRMDIKQKGQKSVTRIRELREIFSKENNLSTKKQYVQEFKQCLLNIVAYLKVEKNLQYVQTLSKKLPDLQNQLRTMRSIVNQLQEEQAKRPIKKLEETKKKNEIYQSIKPQNTKKQLKDQPPLNQHEKQIEAAIVKQKPNVSWDDVAGLQQAKKTLQQAVILPIKHPEVFIGQRVPWRGILLYGPPGTGKTFLAKACATEMKGGTFFSISASDLMSKYVGQSEKTLKALFSMARRQRPSIIFIDEIDSIAGQRSSEQNQVSRRVKTQLLIQMQGVGNDCKDVLVLGATNLPWALDSAVRRRLQKRVYIPLPDVKGRMAMLKKVIEKNNIHITKDQMYELANLTQGYSGSDISSMINDALMAPVRKLDKTRSWVEVMDGGKVKYAPYDKNMPRNSNDRYFEGTMDELKSKGYTIYLATTYNDFIAALKNSKPSVSSGDLSRYIEFTKTFGMDG